MCSLAVTVSTVHSQLPTWVDMWPSQEGVVTMSSWWACLTVTHCLAMSPPVPPSLAAAHHRIICSVSATAMPPLFHSGSGAHVVLTP